MVTTQLIIEAPNLKPTLSALHNHSFPTAPLKACKATELQMNKM
jgi:hypothetical protein